MLDLIRNRMRREKDWERWWKILITMCAAGFVAYRWATASHCCRCSAHPQTPHPAQWPRHWQRIAGNWIYTRRSVERSVWKPTIDRYACYAPRDAHSRCAGRWTTALASLGEYRNPVDYAVIYGNRSSCNYSVPPEIPRSVRANRSVCQRIASASDCQIQCPSSSDRRNPGKNTVYPCLATLPDYHWCCWTPYRVV